jgi:hypothetical protein
MVIRPHCPPNYLVIMHEGSEASYAGIDPASAESSGSCQAEGQ